MGRSSAIIWLKKKYRDYTWSIYYFSELSNINNIATLYL